MFDGQKLDIKPSIVIEGARADTWKKADGSVRELSTEEEVLELLREVCDNGWWAEVPNLRPGGKRKVAKEDSLVDRVMHCCG